MTRGAGVMLTGPIARPSSGTNVAIANDWPRCSDFQRSPSTGCDVANSQLEPRPASNRLDGKRPLLCEKPHAIFQTAYQSELRSQTLRRPNTSAIGASTIGPKANASTKMRASCWSWLARCRGHERCLRASMVELIRQTRPPKDTSIVMDHLRTSNQFLGL